MALREGCTEKTQNYLRRQVFHISLERGRLSTCEELQEASMLGTNTKSWGRRRHQVPQITWADKVKRPGRSETRWVECNLHSEEQDQNSLEEMVMDVMGSSYLPKRFLNVKPMVVLMDQVQKRTKEDLLIIWTTKEKVMSFIYMGISGTNPERMQWKVASGMRALGCMSVSWHSTGSSVVKQTPGKKSRMEAEKV